MQCSSCCGALDDGTVKPKHMFIAHVKISSTKKRNTYAIQKMCSQKNTKTD